MASMIRLGYRRSELHYVLKKSPTRLTNRRCFAAGATPCEATALTEADYRRYMSVRIKDPTYDRGYEPAKNMPPSPSLPDTLIIAPLRAFDDDDTILEHACAALELYTARLHLQPASERRSKAQFRDIYIQQRPGSKAMSWLTRGDRLFQPTKDQHRRLVFALSHCLVAEGSAQHMIA